MKRIFIGLVAAVTVATAVAPAASSYLADAVGTPGKPLYAVSNTGSASGQAHRSTTGSTMKITNDGAVYIWDD